MSDPSQESGPTSKKAYVPALRFRWLTWIYDPVVAITSREKVFRNAVCDEIAATGALDILDLACGSGTLTVMLKQRMPERRVVGLDADPAVLHQARSKAKKAGAEIRFDRAMSNAMPYPDRSFDLVVSCLFFHHLRTEIKLATLSEVSRVLRPGGRLIVCDWGKPSSLYHRISFGMVRLLDGFEVTRDNAEGRLPKIIESAGFEAVTVRREIAAPVGTLQLLTARLETVR